MFESILEKGKFYKLEDSEICNAEKRMDVKIPKDLVTFYKEIGYGFIENPYKDINRIMDPDSCADLRLREDIYEYDPALEAYESFEEKAFIFFEMDEGLYISIGFNDGKIYIGDKKIAENLLEFLTNMSNPGYHIEL